MKDCIFCKIVSGETQAHKIWEDSKHIAFLSIFPNTKGFSIVIPKKHYPSYIFELPEDVLLSLVKAVQQVAKLLDSKLDDVGRTGMIFEGFGVNHAHAKLIPMHGTKKIKEWKAIKSTNRKFYNHYEGYISSHDGKRAVQKELSALAKKIKSKD